MDLKQIKELMAAMERAGIKKMTIKQKGGDELHLEKQDEHPLHHPTPPPFFPPVYAHPPHPPAREGDSPTRKGGQEEAKIETKSEQYITAPLVGTFYTAPSPEDPLFVKVGDKVSESTVVCIIEAMKVMNEVKAGVSGTVAEVLIDNAHPVEFGTKLFRIV